MFADDTNITITQACFGDLENTVNNELESVGQWLIANKLSLNIVKTEYLLVCSNNKNQPNWRYPFKLNWEMIQ